MNHRARVTALWALVLGAMLLFVITSLRVSTDISEFLPADERSIAATLVREVASGELSQRMILTLEVPEGTVAPALSRYFEEVLRDDDAWMQRIESLEFGSSAENDQALWEVYHDRWPYLYATSADEARAMLQQEGLEARADALLRQLQGPMSSLISRVAPNDPFLVLPSIFENLASSQAGTIGLEDGRFLTEDGRFVVVFLKTKARAFDNAEQQAVLEGIEAARGRLAAAYDTELKLEMSGVNRMSIAAQASIESDIRRISLLSIIGLSLLLFAVFRGPRVAALAGMSVSTGVLAALSVSVLVFGRVHGVSLAFGASLIGLAVDYVVHLYSHHAEAGEDELPQTTLRRIWPALVVASSTALVGFFVLGFSGFPGLQEVALFAVVGLSVSLLTVRWVVVYWLPAQIAPNRFRGGLADALLVLLRRLQARPAAGWLFFALVCLTVAIGLPQLRWSDALVDMGTLDAALMAEEEAVRARVSRFDQSRFIASYGATEEEALQSAGVVHRILRDEGWASGYASVAGLVPSMAQQHEVLAVLRDDLGFSARFSEAFADKGFRPEMFVGLSHALEGALPPPVRPADLQGTPLASVVESFIQPLEGGVAVLSFVHGVKDSDGLAARLATVDGVIYVDQQSMMRDFGVDQRGRTLAVVALGLFGIAVLLFWRNRRLLSVLAVLSPAALAVAFTWSVLALMGQSADIVTIAASLMIVSLGVDYGVFLVDSSRTEGPYLRSALLGVAVAGTTTILGFGLLALSTYPLLFRIGLTALIGVLSAMVFAPLSLVLFGRD